MSVKKFRFVSPGIFINEIDNSQLPGTAEGIGPVVIGRAERGPGMRPVTVSSFSEFVEMFGNPIPGGEGGDIWRDGNRTAPTYAAYAAQAWLRNSAPLTFIRLLGHQHDDAVAAGAAGWASDGDVFGLFIGKAALEDEDEENLALAAVIYTDTGTTVGLAGDDLVGDAQTDALQHIVKLQGNNNECKLKIGGVNHSVNFSKASKKYIRKVLNTNPTLCTDAITRPSAREGYFLGETYDSHLTAIGGDLGIDDGVAILMKLNDAGAKVDKSDQQQEAQAPSTGWVLSQHQGIPEEHIVSGSDYASGVTKLFRLEGLDDGAWASSNIKVEISNITAAEGDYSPYGNFTLTLRTSDDNDMAPKYLERYTSVNLNPSSSDYIARRVGDMKSAWSYDENRYKTTGQYPSMSRFIRVVMNEDVDAGVTDASLIPFGFQGPPAPRNVKASSAGGTIDAAAVLASAIDGDSLAIGEVALKGAILGAIPVFNSYYQFIFPSQACRASSEEGRLSSASMASFGATSNELNSTRTDKSYGEMLKPWSAQCDNHHGESTEDGDAITRPSLRSIKSYDPDGDGAAEVLAPALTLATQEQVNVACGNEQSTGVVPNFTLDDLTMVIVETGAGDFKRSTQHAEWMPGSRRAGASISSADAADYKEVLDKGFDSFCMALAGGTDGVNIKLKEPFSEAALDSGTPSTNYAYNTVKRAIDSIADPEVVECNLAVMPGIINDGLTGHLLNTCEGRADTLAIIDIDHDYQPNTDNIASEADRLPDVRQAVQALKDRRLNTSYGCTYFPWVQIRDTINDAVLWSPPSVVALGTMASSQRKTEIWFAPAGFNRGGLTEGSAGLPVSQVRYRLTSKERDSLYEANINPIATFPSEGIVVFGQKTLQVTPSALDRVNVRRLMIFLKKEVSRIAATILFDQNTSVTWQRFTSQVEPFLASVKSRFGLSDFKVILDESTTTPDLIDRNILYAKIMLKPAKAIEFIALDFVITRSGASFED